MLQNANPIKSAVTREMDIDSILEYSTKNITSFGNDFLDEALTGILPNDLCLIGARSGIGKTQLATSIAAYNANVCKKHVVYIALESEKAEVEMRLKYSIEAGLYFRDSNRNYSLEVNYRRWRLGLLLQDFRKYKEEAASIFVQRYGLLHTVYRDENYSIRDFMLSLEEAKEFGELFIVDHLHYFDLDGGMSEHSEVSQIMKKIRSLNLYQNKPFIVIAHLRKNIEGVIPSLEDFMGSGDIGKVCTVSVMLAKSPEGYDVKNQIQKTIISIPKARTGGLGNLVGELEYSVKHQGYLQKYSLARVLKFRDKEKIERISDDERPTWAVSCKTQNKVQKPA